MNFTEQELSAVKHTAKRVWLKNNSIHMEEIEAELLMWLAQHYDKVLEYRQDPIAAGKLFVALQNQAYAYAKKYKIAVVYKDRFSNRAFMRAEVKKILTSNNVDEIAFYIKRHKYSKALTEYFTKPGTMMAVTRRNDVNYKAFVRTVDNVYLLVAQLYS